MAEESQLQIQATRNATQQPPNLYAVFQSAGGELIAQNSGAGSRN